MGFISSMSDFNMYHSLNVALKVTYTIIFFNSAKKNMRSKLEGNHAKTISGNGSKLTTH